MTGERGLVDLHSHLVPGVDDGSGSLEESLEAIGRMVAQGVTSIVTTPHIDASVIGRKTVFERVQQRVEERWAQVTEAAREPFPDVHFGLGREIMLDSPRFKLDDPGLRMAGGTYVLVEFPRLNIPPRSEDAIGHLALAGYRPVIAHAERYHYDGDPDLTIEAWREMGAVLQVNHGSLMGLYGGGAEALAWRLLADARVALVASDYHARGEPKIGAARAALLERGGEAAWRVLAVENPRRILTSEPVVPTPPVDLPEPAGGPVRRWIRRVSGRQR